MKSIKKKIGIFGGSFDPPHRGHLEISKLAINKLFLDQVYWCITKKNPLKNTAFFSIVERIKKSKVFTNKIKKLKLNFLKIKLNRLIP